MKEKMKLKINIFVAIVFVMMAMIMLMTVPTEVLALNEVAATPPTITTQPIGVTKEYDNAVSTLSVTVSSQEDIIYKWYRSNTINGTFDYVIAATNSALNVKNVTDSGFYLCRITTLSGTIDSNIVEVKITKAPLTIIAEDKEIQYGEAIDVNIFTYRVDGYKGVDDAKSINGTMYYSVNYSQFDKIAEYTITPDASDMKSDNYEFKSLVNGKLTVTPKKLTVTAKNQTITYGQNISQTEYEISGYIPGLANPVITGAPILTASSLLVPGNKTISVTVNGMSAPNYIFVAGNDATLTVNRAELTVTAEEQILVYGEIIAQNKYTVTGFVNGENQSVITGVPILTASSYNVAEIKTIALSVENMSADNYSFKADKNAVLTISKAQLTVTALDQIITYGDNILQDKYTITGFVNNETVAVVSGTPILNASSLTVLGNKTIDLSLNNMDAANYSFKLVSGALTVNKANLIITPNNNSIVYGDTPFANGYVITGFKGTDNESVVLPSAVIEFLYSYSLLGNVGVYEITVDISKLTADNYSLISGKGVLTVTKALLTVTPKNSTISYGEAPVAVGVVYTGFRGAVDNKDNINMIGDIKLIYNYVQMNDVGIYTIKVDTTALSSTNYTFVSGEGVLTVVKAIITEIIFPIADAVTYGVTLSQIPLISQGAPLPYGTFAWTDGSIIPSVINSGYEVTFTKNTESKNYDFSLLKDTDYKKIISLRVYKAIPVITFPTASTIVYGNKLSASVLVGTVDMGTFAWTNGDTIPTVINNGYEVTFTPSDLNNYDYTNIKLTSMVSIVVTKAIPTAIIFPTASAITYGALLNTSALTGGSGDGVFAWTDGTVTPIVKDTAFEVTFTPNDTDNYDYTGITLKQMVSIVVNKAKPGDIVFPTATAITYGTALSASTFIGNTQIGTFVWTDGTIIPTVINNGYEVTFTPNDTDNYDYTVTTLVAIVQIVVNRAELIVTANNQTINYGDIIAQDKFAITGFVNNETIAVVKGAPVLNASALVVIGNKTISVNVAGLTADNYSFKAGVDSTLTVNKITLTVQAQDQEIPYKGTIDQSKYTIVGFVNNETISSITGNPLLSGKDKVIVIELGTLKADNYTFEFVNAKLTIIKAKPIAVVFPTISTVPIDYGTKLGQITLIGGSGDGIFVWKDGNEIALTVGTNSYILVFVPNDIENYDYTGITLEQTMTMNVNKCKLIIRAISLELTNKEPIPTTFNCEIIGLCGNDTPENIGKIGYWLDYKDYLTKGIIIIVPQTNELTTTNYDIIVENGTITTSANPQAASCKEVVLSCGTMDIGGGGMGGMFILTLLAAALIIVKRKKSFTK
ncbi:MAG: MBG domain-containing protein [Clostridia bacterium]